MEKKPLRTKSGKVLTDADINRLADEAEQGYDVEGLKERPSRPGRIGPTGTNRTVEVHVPWHKVVGQLEIGPGEIVEPNGEPFYSESGNLIVPVTIRER